MSDNLFRFHFYGVLPSASTVIFLIHQSEIQRRNIVKTLVILVRYADLLSCLKYCTNLEEVDWIFWSYSGTCHNWARFSKISKQNKQYRLLFQPNWKNFRILCNREAQSFWRITSQNVRYDHRETKNNQKCRIRNKESPKLLMTEKCVTASYCLKQHRGRTAD